MRMPLRALRSPHGSALLVAGTLLLGPASLLATPADAATAHVAPARTVVVVRPADVGSVCESTLPSQADDTLQLIADGGPFPYPEDGEVFRNDQSVLPSEPSGYYHEYTVTTPGAGNRGTRRIVTGEDGTDYYTSDHYESFDAVDFSC
ncbi:ribonuclease [Streptomyces sp. PTM05]|uniref:Ribonuclease n=1 Tax=Streptantibioticus parmotrematis TaxID=2873249 RepID=A0ABS7QMZ6_9ACTN|nr:ribonuclease domain-containing protein [Streptantibioticus parmotrematis]MBY8884559.1 ribonuclease [Streptantibioticus parmotrematis]